MIEQKNVSHSTFAIENGNRFEKGLNFPNDYYIFEEELNYPFGTLNSIHRSKSIQDFFFGFRNVPEI